MNCAVPIPLRPAERINSSLRPASGTSRDSIPRWVPTKTTSLLLSRLSHSHATAIAIKAGTLFLRSEEHTSELQSQFHLVCRLLLDKKKQNKSQYINNAQTHIPK